VRDVGGPVFLSPSRDADCLCPSRSHLRLCLRLLYSLRFVSSPSPPPPRNPPPLLAASLGTASTSSPRQEDKDLDDPGCSGRLSGVTTNFEARLSIYDASLF